MLNLRLTLFSILIVFFLAVGSQAKDWRGVIPLHSTRSDVERLLGKPNSRYQRYVIGNEEAEIRYSGDRCVNGWDVPRDTVIDIAITFKNRVKLSDLKIDLVKYETFNDPQVTSHSYYSNGDEGLRYEVFDGAGEDKGLILEAYYEPTREDLHRLRCHQPTDRPAAQSCVVNHCPIITVKCLSGHCRGPVYAFTANLSCACPNRAPTYMWSVSRGKIKKGQNTDTITVYASRAVKKPITVTVEIANAVPEICPVKSSFLIN